MFGAPGLLGWLWQVKLLLQIQSSGTLLPHTQQVHRSQPSVTCDGRRRVSSSFFGVHRRTVAGSWEKSRQTVWSPEGPPPCITPIGGARVSRVALDPMKPSDPVGVAGDGTGSALASGARVPWTFVTNATRRILMRRPFRQTTEELYTAAGCWAMTFSASSTTAIA